MVVGDAYVFTGFLTPVLTQLFFPKPLTTFLIILPQRWEQKIRWKESRLNRVMYSQPPGRESDTLTTEPPGRGQKLMTRCYDALSRHCHLPGSPLPFVGYIFTLHQYFWVKIRLILRHCTAFDFLYPSNRENIVVYKLIYNFWKFVCFQRSWDVHDWLIID